MTLQIATPGTFTTPGLPNLSVVGFSDTFGRGNSGSLGYTERPKRAWTLQPDDPTLFAGGVAAGQGYLKRASIVGPAHAVAESYLSDAVLEVTLATFGASSSREFGPAFRFTSTNNMWRFYSRDKNEYRLQKYVNGSANIVWSSTGITPTDGDRLKVVMNGPTITCFINDVQVHQLTDSHSQDATRHGWYSNTNTDADRVDNFTVSPL